MFIDIAHYIEIARISQYLSANDIAMNRFLKGGDLNPNLSRLLYLVRKPIEWNYNRDNTDETLNATALYMYALCGRYAALAEQIIANQSAVAPVISDPSNQSVQVGEDATFSVTVTSVLAYTIKWLRNGVEIPGATSLSYVLTNAQLSDSGATFSAIATNSAGNASSNSASLTVTNVITGSYYYGTTDYYAQLSIGIDNVPYQGTFSITDGNALVVPFPLAASNNQFNIVRYPISQGTKTVWQNTLVNAGVIPDPIYRSIITIGSFLYIVSRVEMSLDGTNTTVTYS